MSDDCDQRRDEIVIRQTGSILVEEHQEHQRHHVHHGLHARHLLLPGIRHLHIILGIKNIRDRHQQTEQTDVISEIRSDDRNIFIPTKDSVVSRQVVRPKETLVT